MEARRTLLIRWVAYVSPPMIAFCEVTLNGLGQAARRLIPSWAFALAWLPSGEMGLHGPDDPETWSCSVREVEKGTADGQPE
jgi:hypothetical protein